MVDGRCSIHSTIGRQFQILRHSWNRQSLRISSWKFNLSAIIFVANALIYISLKYSGMGKIDEPSSGQPHSTELTSGVKQKRIWWWVQQGGEILGEIFKEFLMNWNDEHFSPVGLIFEASALKNWHTWLESFKKWHQLGGGCFFFTYRNDPIWGVYYSSNELKLKLARIL